MTAPMEVGILPGPGVEEANMYTRKNRGKRELVLTIVDKIVKSLIMTHVITDLTATPLTGDVDIATWPCHFATSTGRKFTSKLKKKRTRTWSHRNSQTIQRITRPTKAY